MSSIHSLKKCSAQKFNPADRVDIASREHLDKILEETHKIFTADDIVEISSKTGANVQNLLQKIAVRLNAPLSS